MQADPQAKPSVSRNGLASRLPLKIATVSWSDLAQTLGPILILSVAAILLALHFVRPAPPHTLTIASGPKGSTFANIAGRYRKILARNGIDLEIVESGGSA